ncbi:MAG: hypothetical protein EON54_19650 [Alcaligenaceae bacterium]|nr:MAG: hypothetical protein EON54_19650 [Alcaligenaceae bacterium]
MTEEDLYNFKMRLAASQRLAALKVFAAEIREMPGGERFLQAWACERRQRGDEATAPALSPEFSMMMGDVYREANDETLRELGL